MVKDFSKTIWRAVPLGALAMLAALATGCGGEESPKNECVANPDCVGCVADGACCEFSINCAGGSICNLPTEDLYDSTQPEKVCLKVICQRDSDCADGKTCSLEKICKPPVCQTDAECGGGSICLGGACKARPDASDVAECEVVTRNTALRQGATLDLSAVARNRNGAALPGLVFEWTSSLPAAVAVEGSVATGGATDGVATLTARVGSVTCARDVRVTNFANVAQGSARVVVVADGNGEPVSGAEVIIEAGATITETTDATGAVTVQVGGAIQSVTVSKEGWHLFTVLQPGTNDVFIPLPRVPDKTVAGGFRGALDLSATKKADIRLGLAGPAIPQNLLDFGLESLIGDSVPTEIDAPELGLEDTLDLPGGLVLGLGSKNFTADGEGTRCQGRTPEAGKLGCYLVRTPAGPSAGWALGGQLKLSQVTSIANELTNVIGGDGPLPIGDILTAVLPLFRTLNHGLDASVFTNESVKVNKPGQTGNCNDPSLDDYDDKCQADFQRYSEADIAVSQKLNVLSTVTIPRLPNLPGEDRCVAGAVLLTGANLPGRGLVPLGITAAVDTLSDTETPDCVVAGTEKPFGPDSEDLDDGQLALSMAPPHSGIEGSQLFALVVAIDPDSIAAETSGFQASALVQRTDRFGDQVSIGGQFLAFPRGTVNRSGASVAFQGAVAGATLTRVELQRSAGETWLVYAPASLSTISLPDVAVGRDLVSNLDEAYVLAMGMDGQFSNVWQFGSGKTLDRLFDTITSFVVQQCAEGEGAACRIQ